MIKRLKRATIPLDEKLWQAEINAILAKKSLQSAVGQIFLAALGIYAVGGDELGEVGQSSLIGVLVFNVFRLMLIFGLRQKIPLSVRAWNWAYSAITWSTSALWAVSSICCLEVFGLHDFRTLHILMILAGVVAAASMGLSPHRILARAFVLTALGPLIVDLLTRGTGPHLISTGVLASYMVFLLVQIEIHSQTIIELFSSRDQNRALFDASLEAIVIHDQGRVLDANKSFETMYGISREKIIGGSLFSLTPPEDWERVREAMKSEMDSPVQARALRASGEVFPVEIRARFFLYNGKLVRIVCAQDITQQIQAEKNALARAQQEKELVEIREKSALESFKMKSQFLANMSHEIRTPMNAIIGITDLLQAEKLSPDGARFVRTLRDSGESLLNLINGVLDYSKIEAGRVELETVEFSPADLVEGQVELLISRVRKKNLELRCDVDPELPRRVRGDYGRLGQVLLNLIGNAVKFTEQGGVSIHCRALHTVQAAGQSTTLRFEVRDSGCGIDPEAGRRLFKPFVQADASTSRKYGGTGLGLSICRSLVEIMGGKIGFDSDGKNGTCFWFELPLEVSDTATIGQGFRRAQWENMRCLILKDSFVNGASAADHARSWGLLVHEVNQIDWAESLNKGDWHVILTGNAGAENVAADLRSRTLWVTDELQARRDPLKTWAAILPMNVRISDLYNAMAPVLTPTHAPSAGGADVVGPPLMEQKTYPEARVLVAEDNTTNQMVIVALLRRFGIEGRVVANGQEVLQACRQSHFDLVLMDCQMPEMDGYETTRRLRAEVFLGVNGRPLKIVALTANAMCEDRELCLQVGMDDFLSKPIRRADLARALEKHLSAAPSSTSRRTSA